MQLKPKLKRVGNKVAHPTLAYSAVGTIGNEKGRKISELRTDQKGTAMGYQASFYKDIKTFADAQCHKPKKGKK